VPIESQKSQALFSSPVAVAIVEPRPRSVSLAAVYAGHIGADPPFGSPVAAKRVQYPSMASTSGWFAGGTPPSV
jgi:hypothetical protein